jgi:hypothetical protein
VVIRSLKSAQDKPEETRAWEDQKKDSYDVEALRNEYRQRLYSEEGLKLLERPLPPTNGRREHE